MTTSPTTSQSLRIREEEEVQIPMKILADRAAATSLEPILLTETKGRDEADDDKSHNLCFNTAQGTCRSF